MIHIFYFELEFPAFFRYFINVRRCTPHSLFEHSLVSRSLFPRCVRRPSLASSMKVSIDTARLIAAWTWDAGDDACGICRNPFDGCCPDCSVPGETCPIVWGGCKHPFHLHCISKWISAQAPEQQKCPMCRQGWTFEQHRPT